MSSSNRQMAVQLKSYWTNINKLHESDKFHREYFSCFGSKIISSKSNTMITNAYKSTIDGWNTAYGSIDIIPRRNKTYFWAIALTQQHDTYSGSVSIGIDENICKHVDTYFHGQKTTINYAYKSNGKKCSNTITAGKGFSDAYKPGDIVFVMLKGYTLSFSKINLEMCEKKQIKSMEQYMKYGQWIVAEKKINTTKTYKLAVSVYGKTSLFGKEDKHMTSVELLKYKFIMTDDYNSDEDESNEIEAQFYDEEEKKYGSDEDTFKFKTKLISLEQQLANMERIYNENALSNQFVKMPNSLLVSDDINRLKNRLRSFGEYLNNIEEHVSDLMAPDVTRYKTWNIGQIMQWISLLDNGAYVSYLGVLKRGLKSDNICSGEQLCELQATDLRCSPFNIKDFGVRTRLANHFRSLKDNKSHRSDAHTIYGRNAQNPYYNNNTPSAPYKYQ